MDILGRLATSGLVVLAASAAGLPADATSSGEGIVVEVTDRRGDAVEDVVIFAERAGAAPSASARPQAVMDQVDTRFEPHILVIQTGTEISFPNNDVVSHHVYSFSETLSFELPLYKGAVHSPMLFERAGLVVLGCNIHDNMLAYVVVVDTPYFAKTDDNGRAVLDGLPPGEYSIHAWTPRARTESLPEAIETTLTDTEGRMIAFQFTEKLFPPHAPDDGALTWSEY